MHMSLEDALAKGPPPAGNLAVPIFAHGTLRAELYTPEGTDPQQPHARDEICIVAKGSGRSFDGGEPCDVGPGTFLSVPAGRAHPPPLSVTSESVPRRYL